MIDPGRLFLVILFFIYVSARLLRTIKFTVRSERNALNLEFNDHR